MTEKDFAVASIGYALGHLKRIHEDMQKQDEPQNFRYLLLEAKCTTDALRWDIENRLRHLPRKYED